VVVKNAEPIVRAGQFAPYLSGTPYIRRIFGNVAMATEAIDGEKMLFREIFSIDNVGEGRQPE
jgi:hypothetical protein